MKSDHFVIGKHIFNANKKQRILKTRSRRRSQQI
jgi:hypothetical protein